MAISYDGRLSWTCKHSCCTDTSVWKGHGSAVNAGQDTCCWCGSEQNWAMECRQRQGGLKLWGARIAGRSSWPLDQWFPQQGMLWANPNLQIQTFKYAWLPRSISCTRQSCDSSWSPWSDNRDYRLFNSKLVAIKACKSLCDAVGHCWPTKTWCRPWQIACASQAMQRLLEGNKYAGEREAHKPPSGCGSIQECPGYVCQRGCPCWGLRQAIFISEAGSATRLQIHAPSKLALAPIIVNIILAAEAMMRCESSSPHHLEVDTKHILLDCCTKVWSCYDVLRAHLENESFCCNSREADDNLIQRIKVLIFCAKLNCRWFHQPSWMPHRQQES